MTNPHDRKDVDDRENGGMKLIAVALVLGALALAADLTWMTPRESSLSTTANANVTQPATQEQSSASTTYFPSQFTLHAKDVEEQPPTF